MCPELTLSTRQLRLLAKVELACNDKASVPGWRPEGKYEWKRIVDELIRARSRRRSTRSSPPWATSAASSPLLSQPRVLPQILDQGGVLQEEEHLYFRGNDLVAYIPSLPG